MDFQSTCASFIKDLEYFEALLLRIVEDAQHTGEAVAERGSAATAAEPGEFIQGTIGGGSDEEVIEQFEPTGQPCGEWSSEEDDAFGDSASPVVDRHRGSRRTGNGPSTSYCSEHHGPSPLTADDSTAWDVSVEYELPATPNETSTTDVSTRCDTGLADGLARTPSHPATPQSTRSVRSFKQTTPSPVQQSTRGFSLTGSSSRRPLRQAAVKSKIRTAEMIVEDREHVIQNGPYRAPYTGQKRKTKRPRKH